MVCWSGPGSKIARAGSHVAPPSRVRANHVGPPPPWTIRSHTAYTKRESRGSGVSVSLSLNALAPSRIRVAGFDHVRPPSMDRETSTALEDPAAKVPPLV